MTNSCLDIKHPKQRGEWAEMRFMTRAAEHGMVVTKPWGESSHYDFIVERGARCLRIQVKSTMSIRKQIYRCTLHGARTYYTKDDFDYVAAYIIPLDLWYIVPAGIAITGSQGIYLAPDNPKSIYEPYREAWHLLQGESAPESTAAGSANPDGADPIPGEEGGTEEARR